MSHPFFPTYILWKLRSSFLNFLVEEWRKASTDSVSERSPAGVETQFCVQGVLFCDSDSHEMTQTQIPALSPTCPLFLLFRQGSRAPLGTTRSKLRWWTDSKFGHDNNFFCHLTHWPYFFRILTWPVFQTAHSNIFTPPSSTASSFSVRTLNVERCCTAEPASFCSR